MTGAGFVIREVWAFVSVDPKDGDEGVCGFLAPDQTFMPMVVADPKLVEKLKPMARVIAGTSGHAVRLIRLSVREELEVYEP